MQKLVFYFTSVVLLAFAVNNASSQSGPSLIKTQSFMVNSIDLDNTNFDDLKELGALIDDARFVELVDFSSAENGASYDAMARLIVYLREELDFDILMWPIGIYEARLMDEKLKEGLGPVAAESLYAVWRESKHIHSLFEYFNVVYDTDGTFEMAGANCQFHRLGKENYAKHLAFFLSPLSKEIITMNQWHLMDSLITKPKRVRDLSNDQRATAFLLAQELFEILLFAKPLLLEYYQERYIDQELLTLQNLVQFIELENIRATAPRDSVEEMSGAFRRLATLENLKWLAKDFYPDKKIILWGSWPEAKKAFPGEVFSLGFTAQEGNLSRPNQDQVTPLDKPISGSLEFLLQALDDHPYYIFNLENIGKQEQEWFQTSRLHQLSPTNKLSDRFNAIFYIKEAYANEKIE